MEVQPCPSHSHRRSRCFGNSAVTETRKLAAILVSDVVGYSRLAGADEEKTLARLRGLRSDLIDPAIAAHRGRVVKRTGDGSIIEFRSVVDAVRCAIEVQNGMVTRNAGLAPDQRIEFRIGIHLGDVVEESDGDLMGDGVNIAARLEGVAKPGGICVSEDAYRQVQGKVAANFADAGEQRLKNIARPVRAFHLASNGSASHEPAPMSLAHRLAAPLGIGRKPRDSIGAFLRRNPAPIGFLILVALTGSLALVRFSPAFHAPQTAQLTDAERRNLARTHTKNLEAYDYYLRAEDEGYYNLDTRALGRAMGFYGRAIELDPNFADAQAGYALVAGQVLRFVVDNLVPPAVVRKRAYDAASRALELDPNNGRAYVALALLQLNDGRHADAIASARRAVSLGPNSSEALANLGMILAYAGEPEEAVAVTEQALRLSPTPPPGIRLLAGVVFYNARQYDRAIEEMKAVSAIWLAAVPPHEHLAAAYAHLGKLDLARNEAGLIPERALSKPSLTLARLWYEPYYKREEDLNRHLAALEAAGIPEWPFGFEGRPQDRITGQGLADLAIGHTWAGYIANHASENTPFILQADKDNRVVYKGAHSLLSGITRLEEDRICLQFDGYLSNLWLCGAVYRTDAAASHDAGVDYVYVAPDGLHYFSVKD
jgi:class 3 adenylate cyclase/tetratricopeptide (TPR) repeat protein